MRILISIFITFVVTAVIAGCVGLWLHARGGLSPEEPALVRVEKPTRGDLTQFVSARAEVEPETKVAISARVSARIVELPYEEGDRVTKGDPHADPPVPPSVLVQLDAADLEAALRSAEAHQGAQAAQIEVEKARIQSQRSQIEGIRATLDLTRRDLERQKELLGSNDISQAEFDQTRSRVQELEAQLASAEHSRQASEMNLAVLRHNLEAADAEIARARDRLTYTTITSPIDGTVTRLVAEVGETVIPGTMNNPGTVIMNVADLSRMLLVAQVDETDVGKVEVGQRATAKIHTSPDEEFEGTVQSVALTHDIGWGGVKYYKTEILLKLDGRRVYSGATGDAKIETAYHKGVLKVPSQAVMERPVDDLPLTAREDNPNLDTDKTYAPVVYKLVEGQAIVTPVKIGASDETHTIIESGLTEEDDVIVGPYKVLESIKHEQKVQDERDAPKDDNEDKDSAKEGEAGPKK